jgi:hypothetical protein
LGISEKTLEKSSFGPIVAIDLQSVVLLYKNSQRMKAAMNLQHRNKSREGVRVPERNHEIGTLICNVNLVPLIFPQKPIGGTSLENQIAIDSGMTLKAQSATLEFGTNDNYISEYYRLLYD